MVFEILSLGGEASCAEIVSFCFLQRAFRDGGLYIYTIYFLLGYEALGCVFFLVFQFLDNMSCFYMFWI